MNPTFQILTNLFYISIFLHHIQLHDDINISIFTKYNNLGQTANKLKG